MLEFPYVFGVSKMNKHSDLLEKYRGQVSTFSDEELAAVSAHFTSLFAQKYIKSKEDAFSIILEQGLVKAVSNLSDSAKLEFKKKVLSL